MDRPPASGSVTANGVTAIDEWQDTCANPRDQGAAFDQSMTSTP